MENLLPNICRKESIGGSFLLFKTNSCFHFLGRISFSIFRFYPPESNNWNVCWQYLGMCALKGSGELICNQPIKDTAKLRIYSREWKFVSKRNLSKQKLLS